MKSKIRVIIALVSILLVGLVAFSGCKKSTPTKPTKAVKTAAKTTAVELNQAKK